MLSVARTTDPVPATRLSGEREFVVLGASYVVVAIGGQPLPYATRGTQSIPVAPMRGVTRAGFPPDNLARFTRCWLEDRARRILRQPRSFPPCAPSHFAH